MTTKHQLVLPTEGITCHAWNADRTSKLYTTYIVNCE